LAHFCQFTGFPNLLTEFHFPQHSKYIDSNTELCKYIYVKVRRISVELLIQSP
jgi:hypothetical protein